MASFKKMIKANLKALPEFFSRFTEVEIEKDKRMEALSTDMKLRPSQIICAVGFNQYASKLPEIIEIMGFDSFDDLAKNRNEAFSNDTYNTLTLDNILTIYGVVKNQPELLQVMPYLLKKRLDNIENCIEATVNSMIIEKYKAEMRAIYNDGIANIEFAEERLDKHDSGFRALLNEVSIIIESKLIPAGNIFYRDTILPQEKRKILGKGLIPIEMVEARLNDENTPPEEKKILYDHIKLNRKKMNAP